MGLESRALRGVHAHAGFRRGGPAVVQRARRRRDAAPPVRAARCGDILARDPLADRQRGRVGRVPRAQVPRLAVPRGDAVLAAPPRRRRRVREVGRAPRARGRLGPGALGQEGQVARAHQVGRAFRRRVRAPVLLRAHDVPADVLRQGGPEQVRVPPPGPAQAHPVRRGHAAHGPVPRAPGAARSEPEGRRRRLRARVPGPRAGGVAGAPRAATACAR